MKPTRRDMELMYWGFELRNDGGPDYGLDFLVSEVQGRTRDGVRDLPPWDLSPPYQRDSVWTMAQREAFLAHWLAGGHVPPVVLNVPYTGARNPEETTDSPVVVIDGKQRIETLMMFARGEVEAVFPGGERIGYSDIVPMRHTLKSVRVNYTRRIQALLYLRLNGGGTPHSEADLERARRLAEAGR